MIFLYKFRRRYLKEASDRFIDKLIDSKVYPEFSSDNIIDTYRKSELYNLVGTLYAAKPKIFTNLNEDNKVSLFVRYIDIESGEAETRIVNKNK